MEGPALTVASASPPSRAIFSGVALHPAIPWRGALQRCPLPFHRIFFSKKLRGYRLLKRYGELSGRSTPQKRERVPWC
jgi:hypothetical protein